MTGILGVTKGCEADRFRYVLGVSLPDAKNRQFNFCSNVDQWSLTAYMVQDGASNFDT